MPNLQEALKNAGLKSQASNSVRLCRQMPERLLKMSARRMMLEATHLSFAKPEPLSKVAKTSHA